MNEQWKRLIEAERRLLRLESTLHRTNNAITGVQSALQNESRNVVNPYGFCDGGGGPCETFLDTICVRLEWYEYWWAATVRRTNSPTTPGSVGFKIQPPNAGAGGYVAYSNSVISAGMFAGFSMTKTSEIDGTAVFEKTATDFSAWLRIQSIGGMYVLKFWMSQVFYPSGFATAFRVGSETFSQVLATVPATFGTTGTTSIERLPCGVTDPSSAQWFYALGNEARVSLSWGDLCAIGGPDPTPIIKPPTIGEPDPNPISIKATIQGNELRVTSAI